MKKICFFLVMLLALCVVFPASAQVNLGVLGGLNLANVALDPEPEAEISGLTAFGFGAVLDYNFNESIALRFEPIYLQKGYKAAGEMYNFMVKSVETLSYIELPVMFKYAFGTNEIKPYILVGPTIAYFLSTKQEVRWDGQSTENDFTDYRKAFDLSFGIGAGASVPISTNSIFLEVRYTHGLINILDLPHPDEQDAVMKNRGIQIFVGLTFPVGGK